MRTTRPSRASLTSIWQLRRLVSVTSIAHRSMSLSRGIRGAGRGGPRRVDVDVAGGAAAGAAAFRLDARDVVVDSALHDAQTRRRSDMASAWSCIGRTSPCSISRRMYSSGGACSQVTKQVWRRIVRIRGLISRKLELNRKRYRRAAHNTLKEHVGSQDPCDTSARVFSISRSKGV